jgi:hypothetical protein
MLVFAEFWLTPYLDYYPELFLLKSCRGFDSHGSSLEGDSRLLVPVKIELVADRLWAVSWRIGNPAIDLGLAPSRAIGAYRYSVRERAFLHFAIDGRAGQTGAVEDGLKADDAVWFWHSRCSID